MENENANVTIFNYIIAKCVSIRVFSAHACLSHSLDIHIQEKANLEQYIFHRVPYLERRDVKSVMSMKPVMTVLSLIHSSCQVDVQGDGHC